MCEASLSVVSTVLARVMERRVAVPVVLVVVIVGVLCLASARNCVESDVESDVVVKKRERKIVYKKIEVPPQDGMTTTLYVKPGCDFQSVCVTVEEETRTEPNWECYLVKVCQLNTTKWYLMRVEVQVVDHIVRPILLVFDLIFDDCSIRRYGSHPSGNITHLTVSAYGASQWLLSCPSDICFDTTTENPSPATPTTPVLPVVMVVLVFMAVLVATAALVVVVMMKRAMAAPVVI